MSWPEKGSIYLSRRLDRHQFGFIFNKHRVAADFKTEFCMAICLLVGFFPDAAQTGTSQGYYGKAGKKG